MSTVQMLVAQKMALERRIEQARQEEIDRQRRLEAEKLAAQQAEIAQVRMNMQNLMKKYNLTEDQLLRGQDTQFKTKWCAWQEAQFARNENVLRQNAVSSVSANCVSLMTPSSGL